MKTFPARLVFTMSLVVLLAGVAARAQAQTIVKSTIPFEFSVGGQTFPSGVYSFTVTASGPSRTLLVRNGDARRSLFVLASVEDGSLSTESSITFFRYGRHYLLSGLSLGEIAISLHVSPTRAEREMMANARREVVSLTASR